jgi:hypothetical protein
MTAVRRLMQGGERFGRYRGGIGAVGEQQFDHLLVAEGARQVQGRQAIGRPCRGIRAALQGVERKVFVAGEGRPQQRPVDLGGILLSACRNRPGEQQDEADQADRVGRTPHQEAWPHPAIQPLRRRRPARPARRRT